jgi:putative PEP-CTERM system integral membrane protein
MIHLGGDLPPAYDDALLEAIEGSHGGVGTSVEEVLARLALWEISGPKTHVADGYLWTMTPAPTRSATADTFGRLAARQFVLASARAGEPLDARHDVAVRYGIVTPYSSMIALVDEWQKRRLAELEARDDRFDRESESGVEPLAQGGFTMPVTSVPEPEEWALLAMSGGVLLWLRRPRPQGRGGAPKVSPVDRRAPTVAASPRTR